MIFGCMQIFNMAAGRHIGYLHAPKNHGSELKMTQWSNSEHFWTHSLFYKAGAKGFYIQSINHWQPSWKLRNAQINMSEGSVLSQPIHFAAKMMVMNLHCGFRSNFPKFKMATSSHIGFWIGQKKVIWLLLDQIAALCKLSTRSAKNSLFRLPKNCPLLITSKENDASFGSSH